MSAMTPAPSLVRMRERRSSRAGARVGQPQQIDLFGEGQQNPSGTMPTWRALPVETQTELTDLMARLLLEHVQGSRTGSATEDGHDL